MKSKNMVGLQLWTILLTLGSTIGLLTLPSYQMASASIVEGSNATNSDQEEAGECNPYLNCQAAIGHINEAQSALKNGDTEEAQTHLDLAKESIQSVCPGCMG